MGRLSDSRLFEDEKVALSGSDTIQSLGAPLTLTPMSMGIFDQPNPTPQKRAFVITESVERSVLVRTMAESYFDPGGMIEPEVTIPVTSAAASSGSLRHIGNFSLQV